MSSPEFKSSATLVNNQLVCLQPVGILNNVCLLGPASTCAIKTLSRVKKGYIVLTTGSLSSKYVVYATACVYRELYGKTTDREKNCVNTKKLLDEVEHDIMNYENRGLSYLPKLKAELHRHEVYYTFFT